MNNIEKFLQGKKETWYKEWFDTTYYHQLYANRNEAEAAAFVNELVAELQPPPGSSMLDLGCGAGRHAKQLAAHGFQVTGIDLAQSSINAAMRVQTPGAQFYRHDMRMPFGNCRFHYVFSFFTSFGYFKSHLENNKVINNISMSLKDGGTLVMDYLNVNYSEDHLSSDEVKEIDGVIYHITRWSDSTHFYKKIVLDQGKFEYTEQVEKLRLEDFDILFKKNGLKLRKVFGDYKLGGYDTDISPRLVMVVEKT
jgi:2-polyprenyl-3-methyl-5-hydroxy-6-metoxy-1,4-benzoquinol methylase